MGSLARNTPQPHRFPMPLDIRAKPRWNIYGGESVDDKQITVACPNKTTWNPFKRVARVQLFTLLSPFTFITSEFGIITVPAGFETDFGSVPALAKFAVDDDDPDLLFASIIHDWPYSLMGHLPNGPILTRMQADGILKEAMIACGAPDFKASIVYRAVRWGGRGHWDEP